MNDDDITALVERLHKWINFIPADDVSDAVVREAADILLALKARAEAAEEDRDRLLEWSGQNAVRAERAEDRAEKVEDVLWRIKQWCEAYPIDIFPEPDLAKARKILKEHDMSVDAISASAMRHVVTGIKKLIEEKS